MYKKKTKKEKALNLEKKRKNKKDIWKEEEKRVLYSVSKRTNFRSYCNLFNTEYKQHVRKTYDNGCFLCGKREQDNGRALDVHHVNYNKQCGCDKTKCICIPLCRSCHAKTNGNRDYWEKKIIELLQTND